MAEDWGRIMITVCSKLSIPILQQFRHHQPLFSRHFRCAISSDHSCAFDFWVGNLEDIRVLG